MIDMIWISRRVGTWTRNFSELKGDLGLFFQLNKVSFFCARLCSVRGEFGPHGAVNGWVGKGGTIATSNKEFRGRQ